MYYVNMISDILFVDIGVNVEQISSPEQSKERCHYSIRKSLLMDQEETRCQMVPHLKAIVLFRYRVLCVYHEFVVLLFYWLHLFEEAFIGLNGASQLASIRKVTSHKLDSHV